MHDANQVLMGSTDSSDKSATNYAADPADFPAGTALVLGSDGIPSNDMTDGQFIGVSLGESLSKTEKLSVCRSGLGVPLLVTEGFTPVKGQAVYVHSDTGHAVDDEDEDAVATAAIYTSGPLDAVALDGTVTEDGVCYIDMPGGL